MFHLISNLLPNIILWIFLAGAFILLITAKGNPWFRRWGWIFLIIIWMLSTRPVAEQILLPLEKSYSQPDIQRLKERGVDQVVVLTGGGFSLRGELLSSAFPHASMYRFTGGLELCRRLGPDCRIIFSGSAGRNQRDLSTAVYMKDLALLFNPALHTSAEAISGSTAEHPANVKRLTGEKPFLLVTSAYHMPRSVRTFQKAGLEPIPYPVDFLIKSHYHWGDLLPSAESLWVLQVGLREYFALAYYTFRGW